MTWRSECCEGLALRISIDGLDVQSRDLNVCGKARIRRGFWGDVYSSGGT